MICFYVEHRGSPVPRVYGYRRTWDIYAYGVRRTPAGLSIIYNTTISTDTDYVRREIPVPTNVVLESYVVRSFTGVITIGLLTHHVLDFIQTRLLINQPHLVQCDCILNVDDFECQFVCHNLYYYVVNIRTLFCGAKPFRYYFCNLISQTITR